METAGERKKKESVGYVWVFARWRGSLTMEQRRKGGNRGMGVRKGS